MPAATPEGRRAAALQAWATRRGNAAAARETTARAGGGGAATSTEATPREAAPRAIPMAISRKLDALIAAAPTPAHADYWRNLRTQAAAGNISDGRLLTHIQENQPTGVPTAAAAHPSAPLTDASPNVNQRAAQAGPPPGAVQVTGLGVLPPAPTLTHLPASASFDEHVANYGAQAAASPGLFTNNPAFARASGAMLEAAATREGRMPAQNTPMPNPGATVTAVVTAGRAAPIANNTTVTPGTHPADRNATFEQHAQHYMQAYPQGLRENTELSRAVGDRLRAAASREGLPNVPNSVAFLRGRLAGTIRAASSRSSETQSPAPRVTSGRPVVAEPTKVISTGEKVSIPKRNAEERAHVIDTNTATLKKLYGNEREAADVAKNLDSLFGEKSPYVSEILKGYGAKGYETSLESTYSPRDAFHVSGNSMSINPTIRDPNASAAEKAAGRDQVTQTFNRRIWKDGDGIHVEHVHFAVSPAYRSSGVGAELLSNSVRVQRELGMKHLETGPAGSDGRRSYADWEKHHDKIGELNKQAKNGELTPEAHRDALLAANRSYYSGRSGYIGPHAWSSMGFQWPTREGNRIGEKYSDYLQHEHGVSKVEANDIAETLKQNPRQLVNHIMEVKTPSGGRQMLKTGSHFMSEFVGSAGTHWHIKVDPSDRGWQHMKNKLKLGDLPD